MAYALLTAVILGVVEGVTEFLPVSSTGHLILVGHWLGLEGERASAFEIFIQVGAILAVVWELRAPLRSTMERLTVDAAARRLAGGVMLAFVPAAAVGLLFHRQIKEHLFHAGPIAVAMIVGGILILVIEARRPAARTGTVESITWAQAFAVGCAQVASLFPGFSRSAATILGGLLVGMTRPVATEFSFYLAIPTLAAASLYSLIKELPRLEVSDLALFAVGLVAAFASAAIVVRTFLAYVRTRTFRPFAWYRIIVGALLLASLRWS